MKRMNPKKKIMKKEPITPDLPQNDYYEAVSARFGIAQVVLYLALFAFVALSFLRNTHLITYQNFYYFIKDLNASAETVDVLNTDSVTYPTNRTQSFALYRNGLAVAGNNSVTIFSATGRQTASKNISYQNPVAVGAGKYLLVYELGGTQYSLYNSYTQLYSGKSEYPIRGAEVSDNGMYAILSASEDYTSVVNLYNERFALINAYKKNGYIMDMAFNQKGTRLSIVTVTPKDYGFSTELMICQPGKTEVESIQVLGNSPALSCTVTSSGATVVLCSGAMYTVSQSGELLQTFDFEGRTLMGADLAYAGAVICLEEVGISSEKELIVFDKNGKILYNMKADESIKSPVRIGNAVYWQTPGGVTRLDVQKQTTSAASCGTEQRVLIAVSETEALLCAPQKAQYIRFGS